MAIWRSNWIDVRGLEGAACVIFDLDFHDELGWRDYRRIRAAYAREHRTSLQSWLTAKAKPATKAELRRYEFGRRARTMVEELRRAIPDVTVHAETSGRGIHLVILLDRRRPIAEVRLMGLSLLAMIGRREGSQPEGFGVEVFPTLQADRTGMLCRLPLTAGNRLLADNLTQIAFPRRAKALDVHELLAGRRLGSLPSSTRVETSRSLPSAVTVEPGVEPNRASNTVVMRIDGQLDDDRVRELLGVELRRTAFRDVLMYCVYQGIPDDGAFAFAQKFSSLCLYAGLGEPRAMRAFDALIEMGGHRSTHCATPQGRRQLSAKFRSAMRYQIRLAERGDVQRGKLRDPDLLAMLGSLLGDAAPDHMRRARTGATRRRRAEFDGRLRREVQAA